jgi:hypothetical protein
VELYRYFIEPLTNCQGLIFYAGEVSKTLSKVESERDSWKERAETAEATLKSFDGIDPENVKAEVDTWKQKAKWTARDLNPGPPGYEPGALTS